MKNIRNVYAMKKKRIALMTLLMFVVTGVSAGNSLLKETDIEAVALKVVKEVREGGYTLLSVAELKQMIEAKEDFVLIDAHPTEEYNLAYIDGARHFGFQSSYSGLINQKNGLSCDTLQTLGISGVQTKYRFQNLQ